MRTSSVLGLLCAVGAARSTSPGHVYFLDTGSEPSLSSDSVKPATARLILAQRLGLSSFYSLAGSSPEEIRQVDLIARPQQLLFGQRRTGESQSRVLILVDGVESSHDIILPEDNFSTFDIQPAPHPEHNEHLLAAFGEQAVEDSNGATDTPVVRTLKSLLEEQGNQLYSHDGRTILHVKSLAYAVKEYGDRSGQYQKQTLYLRRAITELHRLSEEDPLAVTLVLMPSESYSDKRSVNSYGFTSLKRRSTGPQGRATEALLSPAASDRSGAAPKLQPSSQPRPASPALNALPRTPIPSKFNSRLACERTTNNCTGHGVCKFLYNETIANQNHEYFGCACTKPEVHGQKTTWFGGAACQKKDVAAPFWLLTSVTVLLVSIVSMGIGLLFSMGSEELPSVIGAGVSGPRPK